MPYQLSALERFWRELKRRKTIRVVVIYSESFTMFPKIDGELLY